MKTILLVCFVAFAAIANCQDQPAKFNVKLKDLNFNSDFERAQFYSLDKKTEATDYLSLMLSIDSNQNEKSANDVKSRLQNLYANIEKQNVRSKPLAKVVKEIFTQTHEGYLSLYVNNIGFDKIFTNGKYNCLTASALYAMIFDKFNIKYSIKEYPTHVFVVADPDGEQIKIETTDPMAGYRVYSDKDKQSFIEYLHKEKLISKEEFANKSTPELFDKYFYNESHISLRKVAGLAYYNDALSRLEAEDKSGCVMQMEKACYLYPSQKMTYFLTSLYGDMATMEYNDKSIKSVQYLVKFANINGENSAQLVEAMDDKMASSLIINNDLLDRYMELDSILMAGVSDTTVLKSLKEKNSQYISYHYYLKGEYYTALHTAMDAYILNPNNLSVKKVIKESIANITRVQTANTDILIDSLTKLQDKFPFLKDDKLIKEYMSWSYLKNAGFYFNKNDGVKGEQYISKADAMMSIETMTNVLQSSLAYGYGEASSYYVRQKNYTKAKSYLKRGLELDPQNDALQRKLGYLKDYH